MTFKSSELIDNKNLGRFEMIHNSNLLHISYNKYKNTIELFHCESCNEIDGPESKEKLISLVLDYVKKQKLKLIPKCPFVALYIMKNADWMEYVIE